jgi:hypothetical protein
MNKSAMLNFLPVLGLVVFIIFRFEAIQERATEYTRLQAQIYDLRESLDSLAEQSLSACPSSLRDYLEEQKEDLLVTTPGKLDSYALYERILFSRKVTQFNSFNTSGARALLYVAGFEIIRVLHVLCGASLNVCMR